MINNFNNPSYIFYSKKNDSITFFDDSISLAIVYDLEDPTIKTIFKSLKNETQLKNYFDKIESGQIDDKQIIYNKNGKERWASIATLPSYLKNIIEKNRNIVKVSMEDGLEEYIEKGDSHFLVQFQGSLSPKEENSSFVYNKLEQNKEKNNSEDLTQDESNSKKYSKSNVLELSKSEVKDLANKKEGEVISYKSATDFVNSFDSIGEVLEDRFNVKLNRSDTVINDFFNDTNIQNSEVAVDNLFKNTLVEYNDTQISLDTYLNNLGFKTNDLKGYLKEVLKDKTKLSK